MRGVRKAKRGAHGKGGAYGKRGAHGKRGHVRQWWRAWQTGAYMGGAHGNGSVHGKTGTQTIQGGTNDKEGVHGKGGVTCARQRDKARTTKGHVRLPIMRGVYKEACTA
jgi:hypothetical protein